MLRLKDEPKTIGHWRVEADYGPPTPDMSASIDALRAKLHTVNKLQMLLRRLNDIRKSLQAI
jgi:hypothetical protein